MEGSSGNGPGPEETPSPHEGDGGSNPPCRIRLVLCEEPSDFKQYRETIDRYHTYMRWKQSPGRKICWLIETTGSELVGAIGVHSATLVIGVRDRLIGWNRAQKLANLTKVANNHRFALRVRGIGSRVLSELESNAKRKWRERYGDRLVVLETFVQPPYQGTVYRATNWQHIGMTSGFAVRRVPVALWKRAGGDREDLWERNPKLAAEKYASWNGGRRVNITPTTRKLVFVRPLHRHWKRALLASPMTE